MDFNKLVLGSAGLGIAVIGSIYLVHPPLLLDIYGVTLQSASAANLLRGAYGGLFIAFALLFFLGAFRPSLARSAQVALLAFMGGFAVGRLASFMVDGQPHAVLVVIFAVEIAYAGAAAFLLRQGAARDEATPG